MLDSIKLVFSDIREGKNIDVYLTVLVCLVLVALGIVGIVNFRILAAGILATLSILAMSTLSVRRATREIKKVLDKEVVPKKFIKASDIATNRTRMSTARQLDWMAVAWRQTINISEYDIKTCLENGGHMRFLFIDPFPPSRVPEILALQGYSGGDEEQIIKYVEATIRKIKKLKEEIPGASVEVRLLKSIPPYMLISYNKMRADGYLRLFLFTYPKSRDIPQTQIMQNEEWYDFFVEQYEEYWKGAEDAFAKLESKS